MGWLDRFKKDEVPAQPGIVATPDPRGAPGTRIYHEYFVEAEPVDGRFPWRARAYAANGQPMESSGSEETEHAARAAAVAWAEATKTTMRGAA